jgi:hypothetical protein
LIKSSFLLVSLQRELQAFLFRESYKPSSSEEFSESYKLLLRESHKFSSERATSSHFLFLFRESHKPQACVLPEISSLE